MKQLLTLAMLMFVLLSSQRLAAQTYEAGLFAGGSTYIGDFNPYDKPADLRRNPGLSAGGFFRFNLSPHIAFRLNLLHGQISGTAEDSPYPLSLSQFESSVTELSAQAEVNFLAYTAGDRDSFFTPYLFGGTGGFVFAHPSKDEIKLRRLSYLLGVGIKQHISSAITGGLEAGMRSTTTNQLDGIFPEEGNPKKNDWYSFAGLTLTIRFKDRSRAVCPY